MLFRSRQCGRWARLTGVAVLPEVRSTISIRILEQLERRGEGLAPVGVLLGALPDAFGLDVIRANELIQVVNAWIASKRRIRRDF